MTDLNLVPPGGTIFLASETDNNLKELREMKMKFWYEKNQVSEQVEPGKKKNWRKAVPLIFRV
jgi:hypothetical protein